MTQVPAVVGMVAETFSDVYPSRPGARRSFHHERLAQQIMGRWRHAFGVGEEAGFDTDRFVITNAYTGGSDELKKTFDIAAKHRDAIYNDLCATALDYSRGDDLLADRPDRYARRQSLSRQGGAARHCSGPAGFVRPADDPGGSLAAGPLARPHSTLGKPARMEDVTTFDYAEFTTRNLGFVTAAEQAALRDGAVFVGGRRRHGRRLFPGPGPRGGWEGSPSATSMSSKPPT